MVSYNHYLDDDLLHILTVMTMLTMMRMMTMLGMMRMMTVTRMMRMMGMMMTKTSRSSQVSPHMPQPWLASMLWSAFPLKPLKSTGDDTTIYIQI